MTTKSSKRRNGIIAVVAGAALLMGGGTYALWSDSASIDGGIIKSGNLDVSVGTTAYWDVSADRVDSTGGTAIAGGSSTKGHAISSLADYRVVPGDEIAAVYPATVKLDGDNLVAKLAIANTTAPAVTTEMTDMAPTFKYQLFDSAGVALTEKLESIDGTIAYLQASETGQAAGTDDTFADGAGTGTIPKVTATSGSVVNVVVYAAFPAAATNQVDVNAEAAFSGMNVTLTQVRDAAVSANFQ
jgi:alternate signal-mediated exported protein